MALKVILECVLSVHYRHPQQEWCQLQVEHWCGGMKWGSECGANSYCHTSLEWDYGRL